MNPSRNIESECGCLNGGDKLEDNGGEGEGGRRENNNDAINATLSPCLSSFKIRSDEEHRDLMNCRRTSGHFIVSTLTIVNNIFIARTQFTSQ